MIALWFTRFRAWLWMSHNAIPFGISIQLRKLMIDDQPHWCCIVGRFKTCSLLPSDAPLMPFLSYFGWRSMWVQVKFESVGTRLSNKTNPISQRLGKEWSFLLFLHWSNNSIISQHSPVSSKPFIKKYVDICRMSTQFWDHGLSEIIHLP